MRSSLPFFNAVNLPQILWSHFESRSGNHVSQNREAKILAHLRKNPNTLYPDKELKRIAEIPKNIDPTVIKHHLKRIRKKLGNNAQSLVTVNGLGYMIETDPYTPPNPDQKIDITPTTYLDTRNARIYNTDETHTQLTKTEFKIMQALLKHPNHILSREQLLDEIKAGDINDRTIDTHLKKLRKKLGSNKVCIVTLYDEGLTFNPDQAPKPSPPQNDSIHFG
ncbi:MAG: winged helix-turn-helix domain-containing protein [Alphaproteobacteria bacterium]